MKIKIQIKHRWTGSVLFEYESENNTIKETLKKAIESGSNLRGSDLSDSNLSGSDLRGSNLRGSDLSDSNLRGSDLSDSNLRGSNLRGSNLRDSNLRGSNLSGSNLRGSNLSGSNLSGSNLSDTKNDFWARLLQLKTEVPALKAKLIAGKVNGSCYEGECCCFIGTIANIKGVNYNLLPVKPDSDSPTERWFLGIKEGDTPENSQISAITVGWINEFLELLNK